MQLIKKAKYIRLVDCLLELYSSIYKSTLINGVIHLVGSNFMYSYSTLTKQLVDKKSLGIKKNI